MAGIDTAIQNGLNRKTDGDLEWHRLDYTAIVDGATNVVGSGQSAQKIWIRRDNVAEGEEYFGYSIMVDQSETSPSVQVSIENGGTAKITIPQNSL